jgi:hypothetical protein
MASATTTAKTNAGVLRVAQNDRHKWNDEQKDELRGASGGSERNVAGVWEFLFSTLTFGLHSICA